MKSTGGKAKAQKVTPSKSTSLTTEWMPQKHGGKLRRGGTNKGGTGRPASELRERLRGSFEQRIGVIEEIADGKPCQRIEVPLLSLLPHIICANCGESQLAAKEPGMAGLVTVDGMVSASPKDRIAAIDLAAKYGLGTTKELTVDAVRGRLEQTIAVIRSTLPAAQAQSLLDALSPVWKS